MRNKEHKEALRILTEELPRNSKAMTDAFNDMNKVIQEALRRFKEEPKKQKYIKPKQAIAEAAALLKDEVTLKGYNDHLFLIGENSNDTSLIALYICAYSPIDFEVAHQLISISRNKRRDLDIIISLSVAGKSRRYITELLAFLNRD